MKRTMKHLLFASIIFLSSTLGFSQERTATGTITDDDAAEVSLPIFPGAEGFAKYITAGRNGSVYVVNTLSGSGTGAGTIRHAISSQTQGTRRIIVFSVGGEIDFGASGLELTENNTNLSILCHTAPGGITFTGGSDGASAMGNYTTSPDNVLIRGCKFRRQPTDENSDTLSLTGINGLMLANNSFSGGTDETCDVTSSEDFTFQWNSVTNSSTEPGSQNYGCLFAYPPMQRVAVHHNFSAHHAWRCPFSNHFGENTPPSTVHPTWLVVNNVTYNCTGGVGYWWGLTGSVGNYALEGTSILKVNMINNYNKYGSPAPSNVYLIGDYSEAREQVYISGTVHPGILPTSYATEHDFGADYAITTTSAAQAYIDVAAKVGSFPRDTMDRRTILEMQTTTGTVGTIDDALDNYGLSAAPDTDSDGLPNGWELYLGSNPNLNDSASLHSSGYAYIEVYEHELTERLIATKASSKFEAQAARLAPGESALVTTLSLASSIIHSSDGSASFLTWGSSACYDPVYKEARFIGKIAGIGANYHWLVYNAITNTSTNTRALHADLEVNQTGHGYDSNTCDPATGYHYVRNHLGNAMYIWNGSTWAKTSDPDSDSGLGPIMFSTSNNLVYWCDAQGFRTWNGSTWSSAINGDNCGWTTNGSQYHIGGEYNATANGLLVGGGTGGNNVWRWDISTGTLSAAETPDFNIGSANTDGLIISVPGIDRFIGLAKSTTNWRMYDWSADDWTNVSESSGNGSAPQTGMPNLSGDHQIIGGPIPGLCGTFFVIEYNGTDTSVWVGRVSESAAKECL